MVAADFHAGCLTSAPLRPSAPALQTVCPPASRDCYSENIVYMPHSYFVNDYKQVRSFPREGTAALAAQSGAAVGVTTVWLHSNALPPSRAFVLTPPSHQLAGAPRGAGPLLSAHPRRNWAAGGQGGLRLRQPAVSRGRGQRQR